MSTSTVIIPAKQLKEVWKLLKTGRYKLQVVKIVGYTSHVNIEVCDFMGVCVSLFTDTTLDTMTTESPIFVDWKSMNDLMKEWKRIKKDETVTITTTDTTTDTAIVTIMFRDSETVIADIDLRFVRSIDRFYRPEEVCRPTLLVDGVALGKGLQYCKPAMSVDDDRHTLLENCVLEVENKKNTGAHFEPGQLRVLAMNSYVMHIMEGIACRESTKESICEDTLSTAYGRESVADRVLPADLVAALLKTLPQSVDEVMIKTYVQRWQEPREYSETPQNKKKVWLEVTVPLPEYTVTYYEEDSRNGKAMPDWRSVTVGIADVKVALPYDALQQALNNLAQVMKEESYKCVIIQLHEDHVHLIGSDWHKKNELGLEQVPAAIHIDHVVSDEDEDEKQLPQIQTKSGKLEIGFNLNYLKAACTLPEHSETLYWAFGYHLMAAGKVRDAPKHGRIGYGKIQNAFDDPMFYAIVMPLYM
jgi:hypothetical protein